MLKRDPKARYVSRDVGLFRTKLRWRFESGKTWQAEEIDDASYRRMLSAQHDNPQLVMRHPNTRRCWWMFQGEPYCEDEGLSASDVEVLVRDLLMRKRKKLERAARRVQEPVFDEIETPVTSRDLKELLVLTPRQFEDVVGDILRQCGFLQVRRVGGPGDLCADLTAVDSEGRSVVIQCKRLGPGHRVGTPDIQKFIGMAVVHHQAARAIFVTTSEFTREARELAKNHIELWGGADLCEWLASNEEQSS